MQLRLLAPPKNSKEAIESRRNPCYGFAVLADIQDAGKEPLISLLTEIRNAVVKIVDPNRTADQHCVRSPQYIKQKFFHAAVFGMQPLLDKDPYVSLYANKHGLLNSERMKKMCEILHVHLVEQEPCLEPVKCELMSDGTILARFAYKTKNKQDGAPLLSLVTQLDPEKQFSKWDSNNQARYTTVAIAICVIDKDNMSAEKLAAIQIQLDLSSQSLEKLGALSMNQFYMVNAYDKRTLSLKHMTMYASVTAENANKVCGKI